MIAVAEPDSNAVKIVALVVPILTLLINTWIVWRQGKIEKTQVKLVEHVNGNTSALLAAKDEVTKITAQAARAIGNAEGAANKKEEIRIDDLQKRADAAGVPLVATAPEPAPVPVTVIANEPVPVKVTK